MNEFSTWLDQFQGTKPPLMWCLNTDTHKLKRMVINSKFLLSRCPVFDEDLTYLFYGRPAFKHTDSRTIGQSGGAPVVLILKPDIISFAKKIFPFDSGAFHGDRYVRWMHPDMVKEDFEITNLPDAPYKHVEAFFGTNESYFDCISYRRDPGFDVFEVDAIASMISDGVSEYADDRRIAVEMLTDREIPFTGTHIQAIIGPLGMKASPWFSDFLFGAGSGIEFIPYHWHRLKDSQEYQALLELATRDKLVDWGLL